MKDVWSGRHRFEARLRQRNPPCHWLAPEGCRSRVVAYPSQGRNASGAWVGHQWQHRRGAPQAYSVPEAYWPKWTSFRTLRDQYLVVRQSGRSLFDHNERVRTVLSANLGTPGRISYAGQDLLDECGQG